MGKRLRRLACAGTALLAFAAVKVERVQAGDVKGSVRSEESTKTRPTEAVRAPYFQEWNGFIEPKKAPVDFPREVAVVLVGAEGTKDATLVALQDGTLTPSTIVVQQGTPLRIRNQDDFTHKLVSEKLKGLDAVNTSPGSTRELPMLETGHFAVTDKLAPHVRAFIHVLAKVTAVAAPQADGSFAFKDVAPGKYTVLVFRGGAEVSSSEVEVGSSGSVQLEPVSVEFKSGK
jgi:Cupredoxin-like domain